MENMQGGKRPGAGRPTKDPKDKVRQITITLRPEVFEKLNTSEIREAAIEGINKKIKG